MLVYQRVILEPLCKILWWRWKISSIGLTERRDWYKCLSDVYPLVINRDNGKSTIYVVPLGTTVYLVTIIWYIINIYYPLVNIQKAVENQSTISMAIFHCYVSSPEGNKIFHCHGWLPEGMLDVFVPDQSCSLAAGSGWSSRCSLLPMSFDKRRAWEHIRSNGPNNGPQIIQKTAAILTKVQSRWLATQLINQKYLHAAWHFLLLYYTLGHIGSKKHLGSGLPCQHDQKAPGLRIGRSPILSMNILIVWVWGLRLLEKHGEATSSQDM